MSLSENTIGDLPIGSLCDEMVRGVFNGSRQRIDLGVGRMLERLEIKVEGKGWL